MRSNPDDTAIDLLEKALHNEPGTNRYAKSPYWIDGNSSYDAAHETMTNLLAGYRVDPEQDAIEYNDLQTWIQHITPLPYHGQENTVKAATTEYLEQSVAYVLDQAARILAPSYKPESYARDAENAIHEIRREFESIDITQADKVALKVAELKTALQTAAERDPRYISPENNPEPMGINLFLQYCLLQKKRAFDTIHRTEKAITRTALDDIDRNGDAFKTLTGAYFDDIQTELEKLEQTEIEAGNPADYQLKDKDTFYHTAEHLRCIDEAAADMAIESLQKSTELQILLQHGLGDSDFDTQIQTRIEVLSNKLKTICDEIPLDEQAEAHAALDWAIQQKTMEAVYKKHQTPENADQRTYFQLSSEAWNEKRTALDTQLSNTTLTDEARAEIEAEKERFLQTKPRPSDYSIPPNPDDSSSESLEQRIAPQLQNAMPLIREKAQLIGRQQIMQANQKDPDSGTARMNNMKALYRANINDIKETLESTKNPHPALLDTLLKTADYDTRQYRLAVDNLYLEIAGNKTHLNKLRRPLDALRQNTDGQIVESAALPPLDPNRFDLPSEAGIPDTCTQLHNLAIEANTLLNDLEQLEEFITTYPELTDDYAEVIEKRVQALSAKMEEIAHLTRNMYDSGHLNLHPDIKPFLQKAARLHDSLNRTHLWQRHRAPWILKANPYFWLAQKVINGSFMANSELRVEVPQTDYSPRMAAHLNQKVTVEFWVQDAPFKWHLQKGLVHTFKDKDGQEVTKDVEITRSQLMDRLNQFCEKHGLVGASRPKIKHISNDETEIIWPDARVTNERGQPTRIREAWHEDLKNFDKELYNQLKGKPTPEHQASVDVDTEEDPDLLEATHITPTPS